MRLGAEKIVADYFRCTEFEERYVQKNVGEIGLLSGCTLADSVGANLRGKSAERCASFLSDSLDTRESAFIGVDRLLCACRLMSLHRQPV